MDAKKEFIESVIEELFFLEKKDRDKVCDLLYLKLREYDISRNTRKIIPFIDSNYKIINKFLSVKLLEGKSENTISKYGFDLKMYADYLNADIIHANAYDIRSFLFRYKEIRKVGNVTLDNMRKSISSFYGWLYEEGYIFQNPSRAVKQIKCIKKIEKPFTPVERELLKNACTCIRDLSLIEFLYASGLRVSEVSSMNIENIDFILRQAYVIGKGKKERRFYISEICANYLKEYLKTRRDMNPALFVSKTRPYNRLKKSAIENIVKKVGAAAGVDNVHPHRFRRTLATDLVKKNVPIQDVARILGHCDLRTTQVYVTLSDDSIKYNYDKVIE